jgi:hypothetical protein
MFDEVKHILKEAGVKYAYHGHYGEVLRSLEKREVRVGDVRIISNTPFYAYSVRVDGVFRKQYIVSWLIVTPNRGIERSDIEAFRKRVIKV